MMYTAPQINLDAIREFIENNILKGQAAPDTARFDCQFDELLNNNAFDGSLQISHPTTGKVWNLNKDAFYALVQMVPTGEQWSTLIESGITEQQLDNLLCFIHDKHFVAGPKLEDRITLLYNMSLVGISLRTARLYIYDLIYDTREPDSSIAVIEDLVAIYVQECNSRLQSVIASVLMHVVESVFDSLRKDVGTSGLQKANRIHPFTFGPDTTSDLQLLAIHDAMVDCLRIANSQHCKIRLVPRKTTSHFTNLVYSLCVYGTLALGTNNHADKFGAQFEQAVIAELLKTRDAHLLPATDFIITIASSNAVFRVHSWLLYCNWPYFYKMVSSQVATEVLHTRTFEFEDDITAEQVSFFLRALYGASMSELYSSREFKRLSLQLIGNEPELGLAKRYGMDVAAVKY